MTNRFVYVDIKLNIPVVEELQTLFDGLREQDLRNAGRNVYKHSEKHTLQVTERLDGIVIWLKRFTLLC